MGTRGRERLALGKSWVTLVSRRQEGQGLGRQSRRPQMQGEK